MDVWTGSYCVLMPTRRLTIVLGALATLSAVVAALVIFSSGDEGSPRREAGPAVSKADVSMVVGNDPEASFELVVYVDFACPRCREFDIASRDFLRIEAARGSVRVEYQPVRIFPGDYSARAIAAWAAVFRSGTATEALAFHDLLLDRQPTPPEPGPDPDELAAWAAEVGADPDSVEEGIGSPDEELIEAAREAARNGSLEQLPWVKVNGEIVYEPSGTALADRIQAMIVAER